MDREETIDTIMEKIAELCVITGEIEKLTQELSQKKGKEKK